MVLQCVCRRAILTSSVTPASLYRLTRVRPTFLIDEAEFSGDRSSRDIQRLLRGGNRQGSYVLCNGKAFKNFGPKVIASRVPLHDAITLGPNFSKPFPLQVALGTLPIASAQQSFLDIGSATAIAAELHLIDEEGWANPR